VCGLAVFMILYKDALVYCNAAAAAEHHAQSVAWLGALFAQDCFS
jgi:hypothetical protein